MQINFLKKLTLNHKFIIALVLYSLMHVCSWSSHPPDVDPINFTMALNHYDVSIDSPHPPGYPLYVGLARLATHIVGANHAYQLVNLCMLLLSAISLYLIAGKKNCKKIGLASILVLITHPLTLAATTVAETYFSDAFFGCLIACWVHFNNQNFRRQLIGIIIVFFALGLFRAVTCFELAPLCLACIVVTSGTHHLKKFFVSATCIVVSTIMAYLLTVWLAGGFDIYSAAITRVMGDAVSSVSIFAGAPIKAHAMMLIKFVSWLLLVSLPTIIVGGYVIKNYRNEIFLNVEARNFFIISASWIIPPTFLYTFVYFLKPTYLLILMPPIFLIFTNNLFFIFKASRELYAWLCIFFLIGLQLIVFYGGGKSLPIPIYRVTHSYIKQQDTAWTELIYAANKYNNKNDLFVWVSHPSLSIYATRLIP